MIDRYLRYIESCPDKVTTGVDIGLILVFCLGTAFFLASQGWEKGLMWAVGLLLLDYLILLLFISVHARNEQAERTCELTPFWSYPAIQKGMLGILTQVIMNVVAFITIGLMLGCLLGRSKWWMVLLIGGGFSFLIEILQFVFKRGMCEFDDVFHNVIGCMIGCAMYGGIVWFVKMVFAVKRDRIHQN